ncbi:diguanylate cyclase (GGDEF)-like protein [Loktanella ponticola]|uniref:Diguanylate cyclase (GGDEF)-like protein n=1 Tax=Yoonia ponticola TaxID=1524255 RepID=A0A7W9BJ00_9RHOB|nr:PAS domain-containing protein [Yoonia ponticola]MBB5721201.1 diguanylate cyclase (GGDEF)-like protein [Yoonia ponticola]
MGRESSADLLAASLIDPLTIPAVYLKPDGVIIHHNTAWVDWISHDPTPIFGPNICSLIHSSQQHAFMKRLTPHGLTAGDGCVFRTTHKGRSIWFTAVGGVDKWNTGILGLVVPSRSCDMQPDGYQPQSCFWSEVIDNLPDGFWSYDRTLAQSFRSDAWFELRGLSKTNRDDTSRTRQLASIHPDDLPNVIQATRALLRNGICDVQFRERHANGHWINVRSQGRVTERNANGKPMRLIGTDSNVTKLHETQSSLDQLKTLEMRWQFAMDSELHGLWDVDFATNKRYYSEGWRFIRGLGGSHRDYMNTEEFLDNIHPLDRGAVVMRVNAVDRGDIDEFFDEFRVRHTDGRWIWVLSRGQVISRGKDGQPTRLIGTDTDITRVKQLGNEYDDVAKRLELAVKSSGIGVWEFDMEAQSVVWDEQMYEIYGITDPEKKRSPTVWEEHLHPDDKDEAITASLAFLQDRTDYDLSYRIIREDGETRYLRSTGHHFIDAHGTPKLIGIICDLTREHEQASALRAANAKTVEQNTALEAARADMEYQSNHDALTGLPNRRKLEAYLNDARQRRIANNMRSAVLHIDLDRFKQINDTLGHAAGDAVLKHVADILSSAATPNSIVARVGGDEFAVFLDHAPRDAVLGYWARDLIQAAKHPFIYEGHECRLGFSIGIAVDETAELDDSALFSNADLALYQAKAEGRGQMHFYSPGLKSAARARRQCADDMIIGLEQGQFQCVYQPQYACSTLEIVGAEALVRWDHPTRGRLAPDAFLDVAEDLDIVAKIDQVVFERALEDSKKWRASGKHVPQISVNVSAKRLLDPMLAMRISHLADEEQRFAFELLESVFLDDADANLSTNLACIRNLGISIEVDDFGTGHASMVGLLNLQPDRLKIDRQLVMPLVRSQRQRRLVASIIEIGHVLGIAVVAEGVETQEHVDVLASLGCDYLQGYGLARPMSAADLQELLPEL